MYKMISILIYELLMYIGKCFSEKLGILRIFFSSVALYNQLKTFTLLEILKTNWEGNINTVVLKKGNISLISHWRTGQTSKKKYFLIYNKCSFIFSLILTDHFNEIRKFGLNESSSQKHFHH